jgi:TolB-like protein
VWLAGVVLALGITIAGTIWWSPWRQPDTSKQDVTGERKSIAVLPFFNMSAVADNEYFSQGITEDLLTALSKVSGLKVAPRSSSFAFKGRNEDIKEIGEVLQVSAKRSMKYA